MAKKVQTDNDDDDVEEIFTDLRGNPDTAIDADLDDLPKRKKAKVQADSEPEADADEDDDIDPLAMDGDEDEDADPVDEDENEDAPPDSEDPPEVLGEDPRDLALRQSRLDLLEERAQRLIEQENIAKNAITVGEKTMTAATARLKAAKEAGNTDDEIAAMAEWSEARDSIAAAKNAMGMVNSRRAMISADLDKIGFDAKTGRLTERTAPAPTTFSPNAQKFMIANQKWMADPKFAAKKAVLLALDNELAAEKKIDKTSPAYFAELGRRFNRVTPGLARGLDGKLIASGTRQRGASTSSAGTGSSGATRNAGAGGKVRFEESDKRAMRRFGLDPAKPSHRANWLKEKTAVNVSSGGRA